MNNMEIDYSLLVSGTTDEISISNTYTIPKEYFDKTDVLALNDIKVDGRIYLAPSEDDYEEFVEYIECKISGDMTIADSISLEPVEYHFETEYDDIIEENCKKSENILDIFQFLWENIVLEVPLQFTKVKDLSKFHGDGWKLISEDELKTSNNPFNDLLKDFEEE